MSTNHVFLDIPSEVLVSGLFMFNEGCELIKIRRVCKQWKSMIDNQVNWKQVVKNRLSFLPIDVPQSLVETFPNENDFWKEYFMCKIAYGKFSTLHECRQNGHVNILKAFSENVNVHQKLTFSVESIPKDYCKKWHPELKIINSEIDKECERLQEDPEEDEEDEEEGCYEDDSSSPESESSYWNIPLDCLMGEGYSIGNADDLLAVGESKIGGWPDFPKNYEWPTFGNEKWMFGCQINIKQLSYYDRTGSIVPKEGGMLYFFCDPSGGGNVSYCAPKKSSSQPVIYITEKQIKEMGGLERQQHGALTYSNAAKMRFHSEPHHFLARSCGLEYTLTHFDGMFSLFGAYDFDRRIYIRDEDVNDGDQVDYSSQSNLLVICSEQQGLRSVDKCLWQWGMPKELMGKHEFFGCAVASIDPESVHASCYY